MDTRTVEAADGDHVGSSGQADGQQQKHKALRFVTTYGAPHPKRRRIGAACLTCRKRKTACSGERPTCDTCKQNRLECSGYSSETASMPGHKRHASDDGLGKGSDGNHIEETGASSRAVRVKREREVDPVSRSKPTSPPSPSRQPNALPPRTSTTRVSTADAVPDPHSQDALFSGPRNRMPYFRWLGPTAIMPGFKQMVVKVKRPDADIALSSTDGRAASGVRSPPLPASKPTTATPDQRMPPLYSTTPTAVESDMRTSLSLPFYDTSPVPPSELITHLANTFFTHLGCNYPFLQRERFLRDLEEKQVDTILVDAVCALAARFSTHNLLTQQTSDDHKITPAEYGHVFGQRAKTALVDTFPCPTVAAVQAALLLAYLEFGESRDSGLWMYLGISIRMAQDLGMHKIEGLKYKGLSGPTPKTIKREHGSGDSTELEGKAAARLGSNDHLSRGSRAGMLDAIDHPDSAKEIDEQKAVEQERVDTFWAVFYLDRVVSSGVGRRSTLRDKDIDLAFLPLDEADPKSGWPAAFPALIRIVHLYGRVADLLNSIKEPSDITRETPKRLASMEHQVTSFYQGLSPRLHFDAVNFQHYMKAGEGTNFVLLHFWFHTLIVLLHQPTLLKTFEGRMLQLFPNSQQLSMSSAKTIADILSYSQLMDAKASLGNPFTTQPIYIAACAFLKETAEQTATSNAQSRASSPVRRLQKEAEGGAPEVNGTPREKRMSVSELVVHDVETKEDAADTRHASGAVSPEETEQRKNSDRSDKIKGSPQTPGGKTASALAKHTLLATAASQHYQLCYKALKSLETYWSGTTYILTVLDQKFAGVGDPLLYTVEEGECAMERPRPEPAFTSPGWRRKLSWGSYFSLAGGQVPDEAKGHAQKAIGWTLTGTMNSPSTNLAWHYPSGMSANQQQQNHQRTSQPALHRFNTASSTTSGVPEFGLAQQGMQAWPTNGSQTYPGPRNTPDGADMLIGLHAPYTTTPSMTPNANNNPRPTPLSQSSNGTPYAGLPDLNGPTNSHTSFPADSLDTWDYAHLWMPPGSSGVQPFGDMMIESQDVDMSMLGLEMMPWFDSYGMFDPAAVGDGTGGTPQQ